jgi:glycosyltransferase involved in cell wall biosynthesis
MTAFSIVLITLNAEAHLDRVLTAVHGLSDDVVVLDSGSTDATRSIVERHQARFEHHAFDGFGTQKRRAVDRAKHDWVLCLDADEVLDDVAHTALASITLDDTTACWRIRRRNHVGTTEIKYGHWTPDWCVRLFHRGAHQYSTDAVHESVRPTGPLHTLPGSILHYSYSDLADIIRAKYHRMKALSYRARGRRSSSLGLLVRAWWAFTRCYVFKRGFLDGQAGVIVALSAAINATMGLALAAQNTPAKRG